MKKAAYFFGVLVALGVISSHYSWAQTKLPGDSNGDGVVNGIDFVIWRLQFTTGEGTDADFSGDGVVNGVDFVIWKNAYIGNSITPTPTPFIEVTPTRDPALPTDAPVYLSPTPAPATPTAAVGATVAPLSRSVKLAIQYYQVFTATDPAATDYWVGQQASAIESSGCASVIKNRFLANPDISARMAALNNYQYMDAIFRATVSRIDSPGVDYWAGLLATGTYTRTTVIDAIYAAAGGEASGVCSSGRTLAENGFDWQTPLYVGSNATASPTNTPTTAPVPTATPTIVSVLSREQRLIDGYYRNLLGWNPAPAVTDSGFVSNVNYLRANGCKAVVKNNFMPSSAFQARKNSYTNAQYAAMLFTTFTGFLDQAGVSYWTNTLTNGVYTRDTIVDAFFNDPNVASACSNGVAYGGGPEPTNAAQ